MAFGFGFGGQFPTYVPFGPQNPNVVGYGNPQQPTQQPGVQQPATGNVPTQMPVQQPGDYQTPIGPGAQHPFAEPGASVVGTPSPPPTEEFANAFMPPIFSNPYLYGINNAINMANFAGQAAPATASFLQAIMGPGMTPSEQQYLGATAMLGGRQLGDTMNRIEGIFENSSSHSALAPALLDATNQYNQQLNQLAGQMGSQRQSLAAQLAPFVLGFPIQAGQAAQQGATDLFGLASQNLLSELQYPLANLGSQTYAQPTVLAQPTGGGKKG